MPKSQRPEPVTPVSTNDLIARRLLHPVSEAAVLLGVHRTTLYRLAEAGKLELLHLGGRTYVSAQELERFVREETEPVRPERREEAG